ncbi:MAG: hypothetical protein LQ348_003847 [Seirophora lacunosa]|nr:MAG: hypothetical protein LQ348_003847 [Seirophora lacunosa]
MTPRNPAPAYQATKGSRLEVDKNLYTRIGLSNARELVDSFELPIRSGKAFLVPRGHVCRISTKYGPQVGDLNIWSKDNPRERFWASRTRQLHRSHLTTFDQLWSCLPYLRPMCTIVGDTLADYTDDVGGRVHDLLGTRCDPYVNQMLSGKAFDFHCHSNLTRAILPFGLSESDVHDVLNVFQVTGLNKDGQYFMEPCPAKPGDYFEFFAEIDLLCALSTCPGGDLSAWGWGKDSDTDNMLDCCRPLAVEVFELTDSKLLEGWEPPQPASYTGFHGIKMPTFEAEGSPQPIYDGIMTRVLLTGGSGFIAVHVLEALLAQGHSVVTSVRSEAKAQMLRDTFPGVGKDKLDFVYVPDIAQEGAFDEAVKSDPPFEWVIHTASPFHFNITDTQKDLLDPAIIGTTGILKAIKKNAPTVKRVVITSSFAAVFSPKVGNRPDHTYSEKDWNSVTLEEAIQDPTNGYRASKTFAEKAAWDFVDKEQPNFQIATLNPPMVFGPIHPKLQTLDTINTSNQRIRDIMLGKAQDEVPPSGVHVWVDVRDLALAHVRAAERPDAAGKRFFVTAGYYSNREIADNIQYFNYDNSRTRDILGINFRSLEDMVKDTIPTLQAVGA